MPNYKKTTTTKKKPYKKYSRKKSMTLNKRVKNIIVRFGERKYRDTTASGATTIDWNGFVSSISDIPQGDTDITRDGDKVRGLSVECSFLLKHSGTANVVHVVRFICFRWKPFFDQDPPNVLDVMTSTAFYYSANGPLNHDQRSMFNVLIDKTFTLDETRLKNLACRYKASLSKKEIAYKAGSTTAQSGGIYILFISDSQAGVGPYPNVADSSFRINYNDS